MPLPSIAVVAAVALGVGAVGGVALEQAGVLSPLEESETVPVRADRVDVLDCPEGVALASLTRGDRVVATGRSEDGVWIEIRSPIDLDARVWLPAGTVVPDGDRTLLDELPEAECQRTVLSTTTTSTSSTTTSSTTSSTTSTTSTSTTLPTTTTTGSSTTTLPPDTTAPTLGTPTSQSSLIVERTDGQPTCDVAPGTPVSTVISVTATDDRPGVTVAMSFTTTGGPSGSLTVSQQGSTFVGTLGPFNDTANQIPGGRQLTVLVQATDDADNQSPIRNTLVQLNECAFPAVSRITWKTVLVITVALAVGVFGAAFASDALADDPEDVVAPTATARPVPVLASGTGSALSEAVALYAVEEWSSPTRGLVLGAWGAAFAGLIGDDELPDDVPGAAFVDDPRASDPAGSPSFVDPSAGAEPGDPLPADCPDDGVPGQVLDPDGDSPPGNSVAVFAFPAADVALAAECPFPDVQPDEIPIAVISGNPGTIEVRIDSQQVEVESDDLETDEWETWLEEPVGPRPPETFVAHCIAIPDPPGDGPVRIVAVAEDDAGQQAIAETTVARMSDALPPPTVTPIDATMVRIDVPLPDGTDTAELVALPVSAFGFLPPDCAALPGPVPAPSGWRLGATSASEVAPPPGDRPYLDDAPRVQRVTLALPEGEPSLLCITRPGDAGPTTAGFVTTPPDARRLRLDVTELDLTEAVDADAIQVRGTFAELAWTPCGALLPDIDTAPGTVAPGAAGALCASGGDTGAIAAAGGVLDISVRVGTAVHQVGIGLSAVPGGPPIDTYRIPIPAPDFDGTLCTDGVDQPGCTEPEGDAVLGTLVITATWDEGPLGPAEWQVNPPPPS